MFFIFCDTGNKNDNLFYAQQNGVVHHCLINGLRRTGFYSRQAGIDNGLPAVICGL